MRHIAPYLLLMSCGDVVADGALSIEMTVEAITPSTVPSFGGMEVTIVGQNFPSNVTVAIDGVVVHGLVRHNDYRLTFYTPPMPLGAKEVTLTGGQGLTLSVPGGLHYYADEVSFLKQNVLLEGVVPRSLVTGDIDGDGFSDVVLLRQSGDLEAYVSRVYGQYLEATELIDTQICEDCSYSLLLQDVNDDGLADLIDYRSLYLATGGGLFGPRIPIAEEDQIITRLAVGDFDGDEEEEIARFLFRGDTLAILDLGPSGVEQTSWIQGIVPEALAATDLNGDEISDLVYTAQDGKVRALLGPDLSLTWTSSEGDSRRMNSIEVLDINFDSHPDLVVGPSEHGDLLLLGNGDGTFAQGVLDRDRLSCSPNYLELLGGQHQAPIFHEWDPRASFFRLCDGSIWELSIGSIFRDSPRNRTWGDRIVLESEVLHAELATLDNNDYLDIVISTPVGIVAGFGNSNRSFRTYWGSVVSSDESTYEKWWLHHWPTSLARGNFETNSASRQADRGLAGGFGRTIVIAADPDDTLAWSQTISIDLQDDLSIIDIDACDLDGDGFDDLVALMVDRYDQDAVLPIFLSADGARIADPLPVPAPNFGMRMEEMMSLVLGDLNVDGLCDPVYLFHPSASRSNNGSQEGDGIDSMAFLNNGDGTFQQVVVDNIDKDCLAGDIDGDGDLDLYRDVGFLDWGDERDFYRELVLYLGKGDGTFVEQVIPVNIIPPQIDAPTRLVAAELSPSTVEGSYELLAVVKPLDEISTIAFLVQGIIASDGTFQARSYVPFSGDAAFGMQHGELNGDGRGDLMILSSDEATLLTGMEGGFVVRGSVPLNPGSFLDEVMLDEAMLLDFDRDGLDDILYTGLAYTGRVATIRNQSE